MNGISPQEIERIFEDHLPPKTWIIPAPAEDYVPFVLGQRIIQDQIRIGIYRLASIHHDLLTVAWSWPRPRMVAVCHDLIRHHMKLVPSMFALGYARAIAIHEAHHIEHHRKRCDYREQIRRELECNEALEAHHPEIASLARQAEELSPTISAVMDRARQIGGHHHE